MKKIALAILFVFSFSAFAMAHSGGTDKFGCHKDHKTGDYHCH
ncbi:YHYH domain-containing protein [Candidatus Roizmanbacteria bacterium]|nr:YHYH domain-containing protein [Candidatus Roizmanbacteria bacterium]